MIGLSDIISVFNDVHLYNGAPFNGAPFNGAPFCGAPHLMVRLVVVALLKGAHCNDVCGRGSKDEGDCVLHLAKTCASRCRGAGRSFF